MPPKPPVLADVARLAGVSHQTVSRVVNGHPNVSNGTRSRVESAISALGYRPNAAARSLATGRTHSIGVVAGELGQFGPSKMLVGIQAAAREAGYTVNIVALKDYSVETVHEAVDSLLHHGVEALAAIAPHTSALQALTRISTGVPLATVGGTTGAGASVAADQEQGTEAAVRHLVSLGHRRIAHLAGPLDWTDASRRRESWERALRAAGLEPAQVLNGDWSAGSGYQAGLDFDLASGTTAVFASNDQMALGFMKALRERGCVVPADFSVVGFDDVPEAAFYEPSLTTVRQDFETVGRSCVQHLLGQLSSNGRAFPLLVPSTLVLRASTAAPPASA